MRPARPPEAAPTPPGPPPPCPGRRREARPPGRRSPRRSPAAPPRAKSFEGRFSGPLATGLPANFPLTRLYRHRRLLSHHRFPILFEPIHPVCAFSPKGAGDSPPTVSGIRWQLCLECAHARGAIAVESKARRHLKRMRSLYNLAPRVEYTGRVHAISSIASGIAGCCERCAAEQLPGRNERSRSSSCDPSCASATLPGMHSLRCEAVFSLARTNRHHIQRKVTIACGGRAGR